MNNNRMYFVTLLLSLWMGIEVGAADFGKTVTWDRHSLMIDGIRYATGQLVADHFNNGRPFHYGLWRKPKECTLLELRILPMQPDMPVYLPREADKTPGASVKQIIITEKEH